VRMVRDHHSHTRIIMVTAYGDAQIRERAYCLGVSHYFEKPVSIKLLKSVLNGEFPG